MFFGKKLNYSEQVTGVVNGVSAVAVNNMHLPLVDYYVNNIKYTIKMEYKKAKELEERIGGKKSFVRSNNNFGTSVRGQMTGIQGVQVTVLYDPSKPNKGIVE